MTENILNTQQGGWAGKTCFVIITEVSTPLTYLCMHNQLLIPNGTF